jgi:hypothetical protein
VKVESGFLSWGLIYEYGVSLCILDFCVELVERYVLCDWQLLGQAMERARERLESFRGESMM